MVVVIRYTGFLLILITLHVTQAGENRAKRNCDFICTTYRGLQCIPQHWVCDGDDDCEDRSDEANCPTTEAPPYKSCSENEFECRNGKCIRSAYRCDGDYDCRDYSDERNCDKSPSSYCSGFVCRNGDCIEKYQVCNGFGNCWDDSDEQNCTCRHYQFECDNGRCIDQYLRCDKDNDCWDGSDERGCGLYTSDVAALAVGLTIFLVLLVIGFSVFFYVRCKIRRTSQTGSSIPAQQQTVTVPVQVPVVAYTTSAGGAITTLQPAAPPPPYAYNQGSSTATAALANISPLEGDFHKSGEDMEKVPLQ